MSVDRSNARYPPSVLEIALLQLQGQGLDAERAENVGLAALEEAAGRGAHIALLPEMWQIGYTACPRSGAGREQWLASAVSRSGEFVERFRDRARELGVAVVVTYLERWDGLPRNSATLFDGRGREVLTYAKVHTCDFGMEAALTPGDAFPVAQLETPAGNLTVGVMICYDREFPEAARILMLEGAELILTPNATYLGEDRLAQFRARAFENMCAVAMTNYARPAERLGPAAQSCNGHSVAYSGICFDEQSNPVDQTLALAGEDETVEMASLDLDGLRAYRARECWGDSYRRPSLYELLTRDEPQPVFSRSDARRASLAPAR
jgi:predicted amidohydrolase